MYNWIKCKILSIFFWCGHILVTTSIIIHLTCYPFCVASFDGSFSLYHQTKIGSHLYQENGLNQIYKSYWSSVTTFDLARLLSRVMRKAYSNGPKKNGDIFVRLSLQQYSCIIIVCCHCGINMTISNTKQFTCWGNTHISTSGNFV